jgi:hypothetical protein
MPTESPARHDPAQVRTAEAHPAPVQWRLDPRRTGQDHRMSEHMWTFDAIAPEGSEHADIEGFTVVAGDDEVGRVVQATFEPGSSCVVIETGLRFFGHRVLVPASFFTAVDVGRETLGVSLTEQQVRDAPTLDPDLGDLTVQMDRDEVRTYFEALECASAR